MQFDQNCVCVCVCIGTSIECIGRNAEGKICLTVFCISLKVNLCAILILIITIIFRFSFGGE